MTTRDRYRDAKARKNYAGTSPITKASGTKKKVLARHARNDRLADALQQWALCSLRGSPGARAYYDALRARKIGHQAALRQLANRHVGILHGCLKTRTLYNENTAWAAPKHRRRLTSKNLGCLPRTGRYRICPSSGTASSAESGLTLVPRRDPVGVETSVAIHLQRMANRVVTFGPPPHEGVSWPRSRSRTSTFRTTAEPPTVISPSLTVGPDQGSS